MSQATTALQPTKATSSIGSRNLRTVFDSRNKLDEFAKLVLDDFRADIFRLAENQLSATNAASVDNFCNVWTQVQERYKTRSAAIATYKTALANTIDLFIRDNKDELLTELRQHLCRVDEELQQQSQANEELLRQRAMFKRWIADIEDYDTKAGQTDYAYKPRAKTRKRTTKKTSKKKP